MTEQDMKQAIEACRPGSDDVSLPEMSHLAEAIRQDPGIRELYDRTQQSDAVIVNAFRNVPVPEGLEARLLEAVREADHGKSLDQRPSPRSIRPSGVDTAEAGCTFPRRRGRKWFRTAISLTAMAMTLLITVAYLNRSRPEPIPSDQLRAEVSAWRDLVVRYGWREDIDSATSRNRPLDADIVAMPGRWCQIETRYDSATMVYDLASPGAEFACVYCMHIRTGNSDLPTTPPLTPHRPTGRISIGVWRHGDMVYVLAVEGDSDRYSEFLDSLILFG